MRKYFDCNARNDGENWLIAWTGTDNDGKNYNVETYLVHGSELATISHGAKGDGELIADLLNWYHNAADAPRIIDDFKKEIESAIIEAVANKHRVILAVIQAKKEKAQKAAK